MPLGTQEGGPARRTPSGSKDLQTLPPRADAGSPLPVPPDPLREDLPQMGLLPRAAGGSPPPTRLLSHGIPPGPRRPPDSCPLPLLAANRPALPGSHDLRSLARQA